MMLCTQFTAWEVPRGSGELLFVMDGSGSFQPGANRRFVGHINMQELMQEAAQKMLAELNAGDKLEPQQDIDTMMDGC